VHLLAVMQGERSVVSAAAIHCILDDTNQICYIMMVLMVSVGIPVGVCNKRHRVRCRCGHSIFCNNDTTPLITHLLQTSPR
jgi:ABC-type antimicrobial peptide transport system permease subunit